MLEKSSSVLITGGAGFIGSHFADYLAKRCRLVKIVDNLSSGRLENIGRIRDASNVEVVVGDLKDYATCLRVVKGVDLVFHFAANPEVRVSTTYPRLHFEENIVATFNLLEAMREQGKVRFIIFASSSSVYGEPDKIPAAEEDPIRPVSVYGASKASCEDIIHAYSKLYGIKALILRYANVVGSRLRHGATYDFVMKLRGNSEVLEILGDGNQIRSYIYVTDAVEATMIALRNLQKDYGIYNIGTNDYITTKEVANLVIGTLGLVGVKYKYKPTAQGVGWQGDVKRIALDVAKIRSFGWEPSLSSSRAIQKTVSDMINGEDHD